MFTSILGLFTSVCGHTCLAHSPHHGEAALLRHISCTLHFSIFSVFHVILQIALGIVIPDNRGTGKSLFVIYIHEPWILATRLRGGACDKGIILYIYILFNELTLQGRILQEKDPVLFDFYS